MARRSMTRSRTVLRLFVLAWAVATAVSAAGAPYVSADPNWHFPEGQCTYYAAIEFERQAGAKVNWGGHAAAWFENAMAKGWHTSTNASDVTKGSLLVWKGGRFGHVAVVGDVVGDRVLVLEMNAGRVLIDSTRGITDGFNLLRRRYLYTSNQFRRGELLFVGIIFPTPSVTPASVASHPACSCLGLESDELEDSPPSVTRVSAGPLSSGLLNSIHPVMSEHRHYPSRRTSP
ncbi:MAG: CHAP domain-containing protein [Planctomycetes bacterium]|nr:CHAP domain-containing protein [Planctomycetota bacterium]